MNINRSRHCVVCGGTKSIARNYGVYSCSGCKCFFRRTYLRIKKGKRPLPVCAKEECNNNCKLCRYTHCKAMGMSEKYMRADNSVGGRRLINENGRNRIEKPSHQLASKRLLGDKSKKRRWFNGTDTDHFDVQFNIHEEYDGNHTSHEQQRNTETQRPSVKRHQNQEHPDETINLRPKFKKAKKIISNLMKEQKNMVDQFDRLREELQNQEDRRIRETQQLQRQLEDIKKIVSEATAEKSDWLVEIEKLREDLRSQEDRADRKGQRLQSELEESRKIISEVTADRDNALDRIDELHKELERMRADIEMMPQETSVEKVEFLASLQLFSKAFLGISNHRQRTTNSFNNNYTLRDRRHLTARCK